MEKQSLVAVIFIIFVVIILAVALFIWVKSKGVEEGDKLKIKHALYGFRGKYFIGLMLFLAAFFLISMNFLPYNTYKNETPDMTYSIVGFQWRWVGVENTINEIKDENGKFPVSLFMEDELESTVFPINKLIDFQVSAADVTHNVGIYNSNGMLIDQTQAMPGYTNHLKFKFDKPGKYYIVCIEFCGSAHQNMLSEITVE